MEDLRIGKVNEMPGSPLLDAVYLEKGPADERFKLKSTTSVGQIIDLILTKRVYETRIGDGVSTEFVINHNLNCELAHIDFYEHEGTEDIFTWNLLFGTWGLSEVKRPIHTLNSTTLFFQNPPAVDQYRLKFSTVV